MTFSPAEEHPFPGGGRRARAAEAKDEVPAGLAVEGIGRGRRTGLATREAVWEIGALLGRVKGMYRGGRGIYVT
jgi:hypothetical protein